jgi:hypothetical protein
MLPGGGIHLPLATQLRLHPRGLVQGVTTFGLAWRGSNEEYELCSMVDCSLEKDWQAAEESVDSLVILVPRSVWIEHNTRIFKGPSASTSRCIQAIMEKCDCGCRAKIIDRSQMLAM